MNEPYPRHFSTAHEWEESQRTLTGIFNGLVISSALWAILIFGAVYLVGYLYNPVRIDVDNKVARMLAGEGIE